MGGIAHRHFESVAKIPLAVTIDGDVGGQNQCGVTCVQCLENHTLGYFPIDHIELKPQLTITLACEIFDRNIGGRRQNEWNACLGRRFRQGQVTIWPECPVQASRPDEQRHSLTLSKYFSLQISAADVDQALRLEPPSLEYRTVVLKAILIFSTSFKVIEHHLGEALFGQPTIVLDTEQIFLSHNLALT
ncbi:hypothetical protein D3C81_1331320 [compost metagenome]